jgi:DnaJ-domain-containing protein 1
VSTGLTRRQTPEERELESKRARLAALEAELAQHELDLATLKAELQTFEAWYLREVGVLYAELDEIEAEIAEVQARLNPRDQQAQEQAAQTRAQAQESAQAAGATLKSGEQQEFTASESLKKLYRDVAKSIHPDLATDQVERIRRERLMAEANQAYAEGDEAKLQAILREWESSPESVKGEGVGAELIRVIRKIAQVEERLHAIEDEIAELEASDLYQLKIKVDEAESEGRGLLTEMASQVKRQIADARMRLAGVG